MNAQLTRVEKTARTTETIYAAVISEIVDRGWDGVTVAGVARRAGVTVGAMYSRAENASELANLVWTEKLRTTFERNVTHLVECARGDSLVEFSNCARHFDDYARANTAVFDLAIASLFDEELGEVVEHDISNIFSTLIRTGPRGDNTPTESAAVALVLFFFMGRALAIRTKGKAPRLTTEQLTVISRYWKAREAHVDPAVVIPVRFLRDGEAVSEHDLGLFRGVIEVLARRGYRRATIARIARATGMTSGAVLTSHLTKANLIKHAASTLVYSPMDVWKQYGSTVAALGPLPARAAFLAAFLNPVHAPWWKLNLELARIAEFTPELSVFKTPHTTLEHTHVGVMFVACFVEGLGALPYAGPFNEGSAT